MEDKYNGKKLSTVAFLCILAFGFFWTGFRVIEKSYKKILVQSIDEENKKITWNAEEKYPFPDTEPNAIVEFEYSVENIVEYFILRIDRIVVGYETKLHDKMFVASKGVLKNVGWMLRRLYILKMKVPIKLL